MAFERMKKVFDIFRGRDPTNNQYLYSEPYYGSSYRPDQGNYLFVSRRLIVTSIYNRIAVDVSQIDIRHVRLNDEGNYKETLDSDLNSALTLRANKDQTARDLIKELVLTLFDRGCVALVPIYTDVDPLLTDSYNIIDMRIGTIIEWFPNHVKIDLYREETGRHERLVLPKRIVPIIYNPFYEIMNEPNGSLQRLIRTIGQLDKANNGYTSDKWNMIIQLPYGISNDYKKAQADKRKKDIEEQLANSKYGVAYTGATEKVIQLNRPLENNLREQVKDLTDEVHNQLGLTPAILNGTADENERLNYYTSTISPILSAICESIECKWLTQTARSQKQAIRFFRDPFKLIPADQIIGMADTLTRNEIMTSNEIRSKIGLKPSDDPRADELRNSNLNHPDEKMMTNIQNGSSDSLNDILDKIGNKVI